MGKYVDVDVDDVELEHIWGRRRGRAHLAPHRYQDGAEGGDTMPAEELSGRPTTLTVGVPSSRQRQRTRQLVGRRLADRHSGVARRADLMAEGLTDHDIRAEVRRGVWQQVGVHTVCVDGPELSDEGRLWYALWESGPRSVLDGASSLIASGLKHWREDLVDVSVPGNSTVRNLPGVTHHKLRDLGPTTDSGLRRTKPEVAAVRAAQWARSDRQAATLVAMTVQQRLVATQQLLQRWDMTRKSRRRTLLDAVIGDICDGAHSINELDVGAACRARGLPAPTRQAVRTGPRGRVYLDVLWDDEGVHAEVQGAHHYIGLAGVDDSIRANDLAISHAGQISLQIPVLGWRLDPDRFLYQIEGALAEGRRRRAAKGA